MVLEILPALALVVALLAQELVILVLAAELVIFAQVQVLAVLELVVMQEDWITPRVLSARAVLGQVMQQAAHLA